MISLPLDVVFAIIIGLLSFITIIVCSYIIVCNSFSRKIRHDVRQSKFERAYLTALLSHPKLLTNKEFQKLNEEIYENLAKSFN